MSNRVIFSQYLIERSLPAIMFILLGLWTYALFVHVPYAGFDFNTVDGQITAIYDPSPNTALQVGDLLVQVDVVTLDNFKSDLRKVFFSNKKPGQIVRLRIQRGPQYLPVEWVYPGFTLSEFWARLTSEWWLAYAFWLVGTLTLLFLRSKDERGLLLVAFNYLTALWLAGDSGVSRWHVWEGAIKLGVLMWLCVPVYLHLNWIFPSPIQKLNKNIWLFVYFVASILAVAEIWQLLPSSLFLIGALLAGGGSLIFLVLHLLYQPDKRREIVLIITATTLALLPAIGAGIVALLGIASANSAAGLLSLPILPLSYLYAAAYRQLGDLELRANRLISLYIFLILLGTIALILIPLVHTRISEPGTAIAVNLIAILLAVLLTATGFAPFQRFVERYLLRMPLSPTHLLETYATQITTSLDLKHLLSLLEKQILPSLLIRQAVLLQLDESGRCTLLGKMGVDDDQLPTHDDLSELLEQKGRTRRASEPLVTCCPWVCVILPLEIEQKIVGLWLLGRRDPDDFYAQTEITTLQAIANQTAIALTNIAQAEQLRTLHQTSIDRQESERREIAHDLHDAVLNQLAVLYANAQHDHQSHFEDDYYLVTQKLRQVIQGLRPPLLSYGLRFALKELIDDLIERDKESLLWELDLSEENIRYGDPSVELHLFRIVQQALENALRHAQADTIFVISRFTPTKVELIVADDGIGFENDEGLDLNYLLSHQHFGMVGMLERAEIIGATLKIESQPNEGTRIHVTWQMPKSAAS